MPSPGFYPPRPPIRFVGRERELEWLKRAVERREELVSPVAPLVLGEAGIGKSALVSAFLQRNELEGRTRWFNCKDFGDEKPDLREIFDSNNAENFGRSRVIVVLDGAEAIHSERLRELYSSVRNYKIVRCVIITSRTRPDIRVVSTLELKTLPEGETEELLKSRGSLSDLDEESVLKFIAVAKGNPLALSMMASMASGLSSDQLRRILSGEIYDVHNALNDDNRRIAGIAKPVVINASEQIAKRLKREPRDIHKLTPRQYEELIAELLRDMGHEIALTKATRDGGKDILASMKTDIGEILCLVDTKKYREDRKIGVGMVRTLYGTLADYQATSAMLVTTSSYSPEARTMQEKHKYQLSLKDYTDVAVWIQKYGLQK
jgi:restriction system protein